MAISLKTAGTWARVVTDPSSVTIPGSPASGDRMFLFASWKDYAITVADPSGWTAIGTVYADGTTGAGNGTGSVSVMAWYRDWQSGDGNPSLDWSASPTEAHAVVMLWQKGAGDSWATPQTVNAAIAAATTWSASSTTSVPKISDGAVVMELVGIRDDSATMTRNASTALADANAYITWNGNYVESPATHFNSTTGQDMSGDLGHRFVTTGSVGVLLTATGTLAASETGAIKFVIQELSNSSPTVALNTPADAGTTSDTTPDLTFTGSDTESNDVTYEIQISNSANFANIAETTADTHYGTVYQTGPNEYKRSLEGGGWSDAYHSYLKFDITNFPASGSITSALLYMYNQAPGTNDATVQVRRLTSDWDPTTLKGSLLPTENTTNRGSWGTTAGGVARYMSVDITSLVQDWKSGTATNYGLKNHSTTTTNSATFQFTSKEATTSRSGYIVANGSSFIRANSSVDTGFARTADSDPFTAGQTVTYTVQSALAAGTYYWRVRAIDPAGSLTWGSWSSTRSFTVTVGSSSLSPSSSVSPSLSPSSSSSPSLSPSSSVSPSSSPSLSPSSSVSPSLSPSSSRSPSLSPSSSISPSLSPSSSTSPSLSPSSSRSPSLSPSASLSPSSSVSPSLSPSSSVSPSLSPSSSRSPSLSPSSSISPSLSPSSSVSPSLSPSSSQSPSLSPSASLSPSSSESPSLSPSASLSPSSSQSPSLSPSASLSPSSSQSPSLSPSSSESSSLSPSSSESPSLSPSASLSPSSSESPSLSPSSSASPSLSPSSSVSPSVESVLYTATGTYTGTGGTSGTRAITGLGFEPKAVFVWTDDVAQDSTPQFGFASAATGLGAHLGWMGENGWTTDAQFDRFQSFDADGFTISKGSNSAVLYLNHLDRQYYYFAIGGTDVYSGTYAGNGSDNRDITDVGFQPIWVFLMGGTSHSLMKFLSSGADTDSSSYTYNAADTTNAIQRLLSNGFQIGTRVDVNNSGTNYYYIAVRDSGDYVHQGEYTGNNTNARQITDPGFQPDLVFIKGEGTQNFAWRSNNHSGDLTKYYRSNGFAANYIESLDTNGFTIGDAADVNASSVVYGYIAFKNPPIPSSSASPSLSPSSSASPSLSPSSSQSPSLSPSASLSPSSSQSPSLSPSASLSPSSSQSPSLSPSASLSPSSSRSPSLSPSASLSPSSSASPSLSPSYSSSPSLSPSSSRSPSLSPSASLSPSSSQSPSLSPSASLSPSSSQSPSLSPSASLSPSSSVSPSLSPSASLSPSSSVSPSLSPSASLSPSSSASPSLSPSASLSPSSSASPSLSPSASLSPSSSESPSLSPSSSQSPSLSPSSSQSPSLSPSSSVSPSIAAQAYSRGDYIALPTDDADLEHMYDMTEMTDISSSNNVRVLQTATGQYAVHLYKDYVGTANSCNFQWEGQTDFPPSSSTVYLQIYNYTLDQWETVDSDNTTAEDTDFFLNGNKASLTDYKSVDNVVSCRVYQQSV